MNILDSLTDPGDIKNMSIGELYSLCGDLRAFILENTSKTGGHLASNLGVVELTVAIHNVFNTGADRLVFDVGHQCYAHKILTGRKGHFGRLRSLGGISGFPSPDESIHDAFISGHASTSVSVALGMARARTAMGDDYKVIAVIGDGALTGGLAFEGLSDAGRSNEPLIIVVNDNEMSITENVGGLSEHLAYLRVRPYYLSVKKVYRKTIAKIPIIGTGFTRFLRSIKKGIKETLRLPSSVFENMGFTYLGPVDGHNIKEVCRLLKVAGEIAKPVIIHVRTTKGKGYKFAEEKPEEFHGVPSFDIDNGQPSEPAGKTFSAAFGEALITLAEKDSKICAITAAMQSGTGLDGFAVRLPQQFIDVGIAEGHAVTMSGALAKQGMLPVCAIYSTFMQRSYDMLLHDVCLSNLHVVFAVDRAGFVADDGPTHQGIFDVGIFLQMPGMTVLCPCDVTEIGDMLRYALYELRGAVAIRYPRGSCFDVNGNGALPSAIPDIGIISAPPYEPALLRRGEGVAIVAYGRMVHQAIAAAEILSGQGTEAAVVRVTDISNASIEKLMPLQEGIRRYFIAEECVQAGSLASKLALEASAHFNDIHIIPLNIGSALPPPATVAELMEMHSLDAQGIAKSVMEVIS